MLEANLTKKLSISFDIDFFEGILDSLPGIVIICSNNAKIIFANQGIEDELGIKKSDLSNHSLIDFFYNGEKFDKEGRYISPVIRTLETGLEITKKDVIIKTRFHVLPSKYKVTTKRLFKSEKVIGVIGFFEKKKKFENILDAKSLNSPSTGEQIETLYAFAEAIGARDTYTLGHSEKVAEYSVLIAENIGLSQEEIEFTYFCGIVHDIGKIGVPESILNKPAKLTDEERKQIMFHPTKGASILSHISWLEKVLPIINSHHERFDGTGYPMGLKGDQIPMVSRILTVADAFDAMTSDRCYRKAFSIDRAVEELQENSSKQFDPEIVHVLINILKEYN